MDSIVGELVPIFGIFMIIAIVIGPMFIRSYFNARERAQMHETLRMVYEKGQPVPPELIESLRGPFSGPNSDPNSVLSMQTPERDLRRAVVLICVGLGLCGLGYGLWYGFMVVGDTPAYIIGGAVAGSGAIPGFVGLAYLLLWLTNRNAPKA